MNDNTQTATKPEGLSRLSEGLTRTFLQAVMRERRMTSLEVADWIGCTESEIWNLLARSDGGADT